MQPDSNTPDPSSRAPTSGNATTNARPHKRSAVVMLPGILFAITTFLMILLALIYLAQIGLFSASLASAIQSRLSEEVDSFVIIRAWMTTVLAICYLIITIGLFGQRTWAWNAGMVLLGIDLALGLADYLQDSQTLPSLFITVILVFLLNQHSIRTAFNVNQEKRDSSIKSIKRTRHTH